MPFETSTKRVSDLTSVLRALQTTNPSAEIISLHVEKDENRIVIEWKNGKQCSTCQHYFVLSALQGRCEYPLPSFVKAAGVITQVGPTGGSNCPCHKPREDYV